MENVVPDHSLICRHYYYYYYYLFIYLFIFCYKEEKPIKLTEIVKIQEENFISSEQLDDFNEIML